MAENIVDEPKSIFRVCDLTSESKRMLPPIKGYENQPLVSLEEAVQPLLPLVPHIQQMIWTVKQNCQRPHGHLSSDEFSSIMLYTLEWMSQQSSFYFILNKTLRSQNRNDLLPWFLFLRLFMVALSKLPSTTHRVVYRGIKMDLSEEFQEGKTFIWWAFSSCSSSIKVLEQFLGQTGDRTIFNIECDSAKDISQYSFYQNENEILLYPARQFQVISSFNSGNQLKIIHLKEIQPPFPLIHIPPTTSTITQPIETLLPLTPISERSSNNRYQNKQLQQLIEQYQPDSELNLNKQNLTDDDMEIVVEEAIIHKQCKSLNLGYNKITSVGATIIPRAVQNNTTLEELFLDDNRLCDTGIQYLITTLSLNNFKLSLLSLQDTGITDEGAGYIAKMLKTNRILKRLLLGHNEISDRGVQYLVDVLTHHNTTLLSFLIDWNKSVTDRSVNCLVEMLKHNQTLAFLGTAGCNLSERGKEKLRQMAKSKNNFELYG